MMEFWILGRVRRRLCRRQWRSTRRRVQRVDEAEGRGCQTRPEQRPMSFTVPAAYVRMYYPYTHARILAPRNVYQHTHGHPSPHIRRRRGGGGGPPRPWWTKRLMMICALTFGFPLPVQQRPRHGASSVGWGLFGKNLVGCLADCRCHTSNLFLCSMSAVELQWAAGGLQIGKQAGWLAESRRT